jgi:hypothetical protein
MVTREPQPSIVTPLIPGGMFEMDIAEMDKVDEDKDGADDETMVYNKYKYCLVIVDKVSTYIFAYPMISKNITECIRALKLFTAHVGVTGLISVDQDSTLTSKTMKEFFQESGLRLRVFEKGGSTMAEVIIALIRRRLAKSHGSWYNKLHLVVKELNMQKRKTSFNLSPFELFYCRSVDIDYYLGVSKNEHPITTPLNLDYSRIRREIVAQRSYSMNRKNLDVGKRVMIKSDGNWIPNRIYVILQVDENGVLLELDSLDGLKVKGKPRQISRRWDEVRSA